MDGGVPGGFRVCVAFGMGGVPFVLSLSQDERNAAGGRAGLLAGELRRAAFQE